MHSHDVWSSEALHILEYLWERTVLEQHWVLLEEGEEEERKGGEEGEEGGRGTFGAKGT